jgi:hypothetical protein
MHFKLFVLLYVFTDNLTCSRTVTVRDHLVWVHNVVLIECIFGSGKPRGVGILGKGSPWATGNTKGGQFTSNRSRGGRILSQQGGFQVSRQGEQGEQGE